MNIKKNNMNIEIKTYHDFNSIEMLSEEWDSFIREYNQDIYSTYDWCRIWWKYYGNNRSLHIHVIRIDGSIAGILPIFTEKLLLGAVKIAKQIGSDYTLQTCNPAVKPEVLTFVIEFIDNYYLKNEKCDFVCYSRLVQQDQFISLNKQLTQGNKLKWLHCFPQRTYTIFDLPASFDEYLNRLDKSSRQNFRRDTNLLNRNFKLTKENCNDENLIEEIESFATLHKKQWEAEGKLGHFGDWPDAFEFNKELVEVLGKKGRVRFFKIIADEKVISSQFCFIFGNWNFWRLPARLSDDMWRRYGLGRNGLIFMIRDCIEQGISHIEAGQEHYSYKVKLGGVEYQGYNLYFGINNKKWKFSAYICFCKLLEIIYYKIFFRRIFRMLHIRCPLWRFWIKHQY